MADCDGTPCFSATEHRDGCPHTADSPHHSDALRRKLAHYVQVRDTARELTDEIERELTERFRRYFDRPGPIRYSCSASDYHLSLERVEITELGFIGANPTLEWRHNCAEHGYDLTRICSVMLPWAYVVDPDGWEFQEKAQLEQRERERDAKREAEERRQLEQLRAKYPDA